MSQSYINLSTTANFPRLIACLYFSMNFCLVETAILKLTLSLSNTILGTFATQDHIKLHYTVKS